MIEKNQYGLTPEEEQFLSEVDSTVSALQEVINEIKQIQYTTNKVIVLEHGQQYDGQNFHKQVDRKTFNEAYAKLKLRFRLIQIK